MHKPGKQRLHNLAREASKETGLKFGVIEECTGLHKGTPRYRYAIGKSGEYPGIVTPMGSPAQVEQAFSVCLARFRQAREVEALA